MEIRTVLFDVGEVSENILVKTWMKTTEEKEVVLNCGSTTKQQKPRITKLFLTGPDGLAGDRKEGL